MGKVLLLGLGGTGSRVVNNVAKELYNGLFTVTELADGLQLELTSEAHDPITCTLTASDDPFVLPSLEDGQLLSPQQIRQMLF